MTYPTHCTRLVKDEATGQPRTCGQLVGQRHDEPLMFCDECLHEIARDYSGQVEAEFNDNWSEKK